METATEKIEKLGLDADYLLSKLGLERKPSFLATTGSSLGLLLLGAGIGVVVGMAIGQRPVRGIRGQLRETVRSASEALLDSPLLREEEEQDDLDQGAYRGSPGMRSQQPAGMSASGPGSASGEPWQPAG